MSVRDHVLAAAGGLTDGFRGALKAAGWGAPTTADQIVPPQQWVTGADTLWWARQDMTRPYSQHGTVYRAVRAIATSFAQLDTEVWPAGPRENSKAVPDHWLPRLLDSPSPMLRGDQLKEVVVTGLQMTGEVFLLHQAIARDTANGPEYPHQLWMLDSRSMTPRRDAQGQLAGWIWQYGGQRIPVALEELTFLHLYNPYDPFRGLGPLQAAILEAQGDYDASAWNRALFRNSAVPPIVFSPTEGEWTPEDRDAFLKSWYAKVGSAQNAGLAAALPWGVKVDPLKLTQQEMDWLDGRRFSREQVLSVFGVPPAIAGVFEYANYANSREQMKFFWHNTVLPLVRYVQSVLTLDLLARYDPGFVFYFKTEPVLADIAAADYQAKVETGVKLWGLGFPAADVNDRLELGMDVKNKPWLEEGFLPFSVTPAKLVMSGGGGGRGGAGSGAGGQGGNGAPADGADPMDEGDGTEPAASGAAGRPTGAKGSRAPAARRGRWGVLAGLWADVARGLNRRLRSYFWGLRSQTLARLAEASKSATWSPLEEAVRRHVAYRRDEVLLKIAYEEVDGVLFDLAGAEVELRSISQQAWLRAIARGADALAGETGITVEFDYLDPRVKAFLASKLIKVVGIPARVREDLRRELITGVGKGEAVRDLAARVRDVFDVERSRSVTIARTETAQAFGFGHYAAMRQAGIQRHEWVTSEDDRVRDSHEAIDGDVQVLGDSFVQGASLTYPGDPDAPPEEVINCRCVTVPVVEPTPDEEGD